MRDKPVQWMTVEELREERERTRPTWEEDRIDVGAFLQSGCCPAGRPMLRATRRSATSSADVSASPTCSMSVESVARPSTRDEP